MLSLHILPNSQSVPQFALFVLFVKQPEVPAICTLCTFCQTVRGSHNLLVMQFLLFVHVQFVTHAVNPVIGLFYNNGFFPNTNILSLGSITLQFALFALFGKWKQDSAICATLILLEANNGPGWVFSKPQEGLAICAFCTFCQLECPAIQNKILSLL